MPQQLRSDLTAVSRDVSLRLLGLWPIFDPADFNGSLGRWLAAVIPTLAAAYSQAVRVADTGYRRIRVQRTGDLWLDQVDPPGFVTVAARRSLIITGPVATERALRQGRNLTTALQLGGSWSAATGGMHALRGGREHLTAMSRRDPAARGWQRITGGSPCGFCEGLAGIEFTGSRGPSGDNVAFQAHANCQCSAIPLF